MCLESRFCLVEGVGRRTFRVPEGIDHDQVRGKKGKKKNDRACGGKENPGCKPCRWRYISSNAWRLVQLGPGSREKGKWSPTETQKTLGRKKTGGISAVADGNGFSSLRGAVPNRDAKREKGGQQGPGDIKLTMELGFREGRITEKGKV